MSRHPLAIAILGLIGLGLACLPGCEKEEEQKLEAADVAAEEARVQPGDRRESQQWLEEQAWTRAVRSGVPGDADEYEERFYKHLGAITLGVSHRLAGYEEGSRRTAEYVEHALRAAGVDEVYIQEFPVVWPVTTECELLIDGETAAEEGEFFPARPNVLQASVTPAEGLTGRTVYVADGEVTSYPTLVDGRIVVMDFEAGDDWQSAFALGAKAVIFVEPENHRPAPRAWHHVNIPANFPRFYVTREAADRLKLRQNREVTIKSAVRWETLWGRNVIGVLRGRAPKYGGGKPQALLLSAVTDSYSEVPELSVGARQAANCAALLSMAYDLQQNRPKRDVVFCFFDGEAQSHAGARAFYGDIYRQKKGVSAQTLEERVGTYNAERDFYQALKGMCERILQRWEKIQEARRLEEAGEPVPGDLQAEIDRLYLFSEETSELPKHDRIRKRLQRETKIVDSLVLDQLRPLRLELAELKGRLNNLEEELAQLRGKAERSDEEQRRLEELTRRLEELTRRRDAMAERERELSVEDLAWNSVERVLYEQRDALDEAVIREIFEDTKDPEVRRKLIERTPNRYRDLARLTRQLCTERMEELQRDIARAEQAAALRQVLGPDAAKILLHLSINLGDGRDRWTLIHGDDTLPLGEDATGNYQFLFNESEEIRESAPDDLAHFELAALKSVFPNRTFAPATFADPSNVARIFGVPNLSVMTAMDPLPREGQPVDTLAALDAGRMVRQSREVAYLIRRLGSNDRIATMSSKVGADARYMETGWNVTQDRPSGPSVKRAGGGSAMADLPIRDAVVVSVAWKDGPWNTNALEQVPPGHNEYLTSRTNTNGTFSLPVHLKGYYKKSILFAGTFDRATTGERIADEKPAAGGRGILAAVTNNETLIAEANLQEAIVQFQSNGVSLIGYGFNRRKLPTDAMRSQADAPFLADRHLVCELGDVVSVFVPQDADGLKIFNKAAAIVLNNTEQNFRGTGILLGEASDQWTHPATPFTAAHDLINVNHERLYNLLAANNIKQPSLMGIHDRSEELYDNAMETRELLLLLEENPDAEFDTPTHLEGIPRENWADKQIGDLLAAAALARGAYEPITGVLNDLVTAVVLLLLLAMPFAYALERLLVGTPHIYRQIGWFSVFFLLTFVVLYFVNPAFRIASTPVIIFLAFTIILLSSLVIFIMVRKLQTEIKKMQGLSSTVHSADVSRLSTMMAAVNMGISTMRRRPIRTLLTAMTVVLLTFTILTFASFGSRWGVRETYEGPLDGPPRILVREQLFSPIPEGTYRALRGHFQGRADVVPRYWVAPSAKQAQAAMQSNQSHEMLLATADLSGKVRMEAAMGVDPRDLSHQPALARMLSVLELTDEEIELNARRREAGEPELTNRELAGRRLEAGGCFLTDAVARELELGAADIGRPLVLHNQRLTFAGLLQKAMSGHSTLDGTPIRPVNYQTSAGGSRDALKETTSESLVESQDVKSAQFVHYPLDSVAVIPAAVAAEMGDPQIASKIASLTVYPRDSADVQEVAELTASMAKLPTYAGQRGGVQRMLFTSLTEASGVRDLLIPVVLGGMIVFATMLGSVSDREREIYTFSSLGLAPPHVAGLFFAEASIYAVVGGMGGYLLGQLVARVLGWLSSLGYVAVPTMNYSSTNAIVTILIVMGTVMVSTIYPALKASRSANPGIQRRWRIPKPKENLYDLVFPFTVSAYDITGVVSFLKEHFDNYRDASLGDFATTRCRIFRQADNDMLGFDATVALAPFDLGVNQRFVLLSQPSDIEGIDEVRILIYRISGANGDWQRSNRVFINDLRKQLLIWRSLPQDVMDNYRQRTLQEWDRLPVLRLDADNVAEDASERAEGEDEEDLTA